MRGVEVPEVGEDFTADPVELFFDLSYVFALAQLVYFLAHHPTWPDAGRALLLLTLLWLTWTQFTWSANAVSGNDPRVRAWFLVATVAAVPMGASVQTAFGGGGLAFALSQVTILGMGLLTMYVGLPQDSPVRRSLVRYAIPNVVTMPVLVAGAFLDGGARVLVWLAVPVIIAVFGMFRAARLTWIVRPGHFAERHGLILIVALGEVVVASGLGVAETLRSLGEGSTTPDPATFVALAAAGLLAALLWWAYFDRAQHALEHTAEQLPMEQRGPFARDVWSLWHLPLVAGVVAVAAALEEVTLHPADALPGAYRTMLGVGLASFLLGIVGALYRAMRVLVLERVVAVGILLAVVLGAGGVSGLALVLSVDVVLLVLLVVEQLRTRRPRRAEVGTPGG